VTKIKANKSSFSCGGWVAAWLLFTACWFSALPAAHASELLFQANFTPSAQANSASPKLIALEVANTRAHVLLGEEEDHKLLFLKTIGLSKITSPLRMTGSDFPGAPGHRRPGAGLSYIFGSDSSPPRC